MYKNHYFLHVNCSHINRHFQSEYYMSDNFQHDIRGLSLVISNNSVLLKWMIRHEWMLFIHFMVLGPLNQLIVKSRSSYYVYDNSQICLIC